MIIHLTNLTTNTKKYGIKGVDIYNGKQTYPYDTYGEAAAQERLLRLQRKPKDPRFKDPEYISALKAVGKG